MFIIYNRPIPKILSEKDTLSIVEVEGKKVSALEDPSVMWLLPNEYLVKITKPSFLLQEAKDKKLVPAIYHSHAIYLNVLDAHIAAGKMLEEHHKLMFQKNGQVIPESKLVEKCSKIPVIYL